MAHYAIQCWDLECYVSGSWLECVGRADRGSYDLLMHSNGTNEKLVMQRELKVPRTEQIVKIKLNYRELPFYFKSALQVLTEYFDKLDRTQTQDIIKGLEDFGSVKIQVINNDAVESYELVKEYLVITSNVNTITHETYYPHVIEPSFGIDRLMYAILEQNFSSRVDDAKRLVLSLKPSIAPCKLALFYLYSREDMIEQWNNIKTIFDKSNIKYYTETSSVSIGKKYVRADEMGIPYAITVDTDTKNDCAVTVRNRDDMTQIRLSIDYLLSYLLNQIG